MLRRMLLLLTITLVLATPALAQNEPSNIRNAFLAGAGPGEFPLYQVGMDNSFVISDFNWTWFSTPALPAVRMEGLVEIAMQGQGGWAWQVLYATDNAGVVQANTSNVGAHWIGGVYCVPAADVVVRVTGIPANQAWRASMAGYIAPPIFVADAKRPSASADAARLSVFPNPAGARTASAVFTVPADGPVDVGVFDLQGRLVRTLLDGKISAGTHTFLWDGNDQAGEVVAGGVYFVRARGATFDTKRKVTLLP